MAIKRRTEKLKAKAERLKRLDKRKKEVTKDKITESFSRFVNVIVPNVLAGCPQAERCVEYGHQSFQPIISSGALSALATDLIPQIKQAFPTAIKTEALIFQKPFCNCHGNVLETIEEEGGEAVFGWIVSVTAGVLLQKNWHCVWRDPKDSVLIETTEPCQNYQGLGFRSVFIEDPSVKPSAKSQSHWLIPKSEATEAYETLIAKADSNNNLPYSRRQEYWQKVQYLEKAAQVILAYLMIQTGRVILR